MAVIDWTTVKNAIADWVTTVSGLTVHWAGQEAPRPAYPYAVIDVLSGAPEHHDSNYILGDGLNIRIATRGDRRVTFSIEVLVSFEGAVYSHTTDAHARAEELQSSLERDAVRSTLTAAGVAVLDSHGAISNRRTVLDAGFLSRVGFDLVTGVTASYVPGTAEGAIERIEAESTVASRVSDDYYGAAGDPTPVPPEGD